MGSNDKYNIEWQNKLDKKGNCTEIQIKILHQKDDNKGELGLTIHAYLTTALIKVQGKMFDFFVKDLFPGIKEFVERESSNDEILSVQKQTVSTSHSKQQEITEPTLMGDVKESLYFLKKINFVELFSHIQKGQETLVAKFQKLEDNQAHISKKLPKMKGMLKM